MTQPLVSAVILNYRGSRDVPRCCEALRAQTIADQMEIIVVDNHSDDDSIQYIRNYARLHPGIRIVETTGNRGFGHGYNVGISYARGKYLLINNPAKLLAPDAVATMVEYLESHPDVGIVAPKLVHDDGTIRDSYRSFPTVPDVFIKRTNLRKIFTGRMRRYLQWDRDPETAGETDWVVGGCLMMPRDLFTSLSGFDDRFFLFFEDTDLCRRVWGTGKKVVYLPQAQGSDRKRRLSEGGVFSLLFTAPGRAHIASAVRYFWKWRKA